MQHTYTVTDSTTLSVMWQEMVLDFGPAGGGTPISRDIHLQPLAIHNMLIPLLSYMMKHSSHILHGHCLSYYSECTGACI